MKKNKNKNMYINLIILATTVSLFAGCAAQNSIVGSSVQESVEQTKSTPSSNTGTNVFTSATENSTTSNIITTENSATSNIIDTKNQYTDKDTNSSWDATTATKITLNNTTIKVEGTGAVANGNVLTINSAGTYVLSGTLSDGQILINTTKNDLVRLILNGTDITNKTGAAIYAPQCDKLIITLAEGSKNIITDGGTNFIYTNVANEEPDAAIFVKDDLVINGTGKLTVNAGFNNGIGTKDDMLIVSGEYIINAKNHGFRGRDSITILDGNFTVTSGNDGIQSNNNEDATKGWISLEGGKFNITAAHDGVSSEGTLSVLGGEYNITTGGGVSKTETVASTETTSDSFKGLKATTNIAIAGGKFTINSYDDSIHANGNISISGGEFKLSSADDGVHADGNLNVSGGNIDVTQSYEGLESATMDISGGIVNLVATDDGINAAGGVDGSAESGKFGKDPFASSGDYYINITGGTVSLLAEGDGIDSNGTVNISGGLVTSFIQSSPDNGAIDSDGTLSITGGVVIYGGTGIGQVTNTSQSYVYMTGAKANNEITVQKDNKTLVNFTPTSDYEYIVISSKDIKTGESYEIYSGETLLSTVTAGTGGEGMGGRGGMGKSRQKPSGVKPQ